MRAKTLFCVGLAVNFDEGCGVIISDRPLCLQFFCTFPFTFLLLLGLVILIEAELELELLVLLLHLGNED